MSTAIAVVLTECGIAIAADGLVTEVGTYRVLNRRVQKIFPIGHGRKLAYTIAGVVGANKPNSDEVLFDFAAELPKAVDDLAVTAEPTLYHFAKAVATQLLAAFWSAIGGLPHVSESITRILFVGYHDGPECVQLEFTHPASGETFYRLSSLQLRLDIPIGYGSNPIWARLLGLQDDPDFAKYLPAVSLVDVTILRAVNIAKNCVRAHYTRMARAIDPEICRAIGGHLHAAQITPAGGFDWVIKPKTRRAVPRSPKRDP